MAEPLGSVVLRRGRLERAPRSAGGSIHPARYGTERGEPPAVSASDRYEWSLRDHLRGRGRRSREAGPAGTGSIGVEAWVARNGKTHCCMVTNLNAHVRLAARIRARLRIRVDRPTRPANSATAPLFRPRPTTLIRMKMPTSCTR